MEDPEGVESQEEEDEYIQVDDIMPLTARRKRSQGYPKP